MRHALFWFGLLLFLSAVMLFAENAVFALLFFIIAAGIVLWPLVGKEVKADIARESAEMEKTKANVPDLAFSYDWSEKEPGANPFAILSQGCKNFIDGMKKVFKR